MRSAQEWRSHIPNYLTFARVGAVPVLIATFYVEQSAAARVPAVLFGAIALTDWLDGYLARRWKVQSELGAFLDPVADKFLVCTALVLLSGALGVLVAGPTALIICRELGVSALRERLAVLGAPNFVPVGQWGKVKTATQLVALFLLLLSGAGGPGGRPLHMVGSLTLLGRTFTAATDTLLRRAGLNLLYLAAALTASSAVPYVRTAWPVLVAGKPGIPPSKVD